MSSVDLTPFGFTPTESRVYEVLLSGGPGTGYAIARNAGLARANAYSALEGLVAKGAARVEEGRPKRFRPEPPATLLARITNDQGAALERLGQSIEGRGSAESATLVEVDSPRAALQLLSHDIARASRSVRLLAPPEAYPILAPVLRRAVAMGLDVRLWSTGEASLPFTEIGLSGAPEAWPGLPLVAVVDDRSAVMASREGAEVQGHWSTARTFVAAARLVFERLGQPA
jgi:HTH-type transcriptional regulator, sugar sensing transcriptional regulator